MLFLLAILCCTSLASNFVGYFSYLKITGVAWINDVIEKNFVPNLYQAKVEYEPAENIIAELVSYVTPVLKYYHEQEEVEVVVEDEMTYEMILQAQAFDENMVDENGELIINEVIQEEPESIVMEMQEPIDLTRLNDLEYLLSNYYILDTSASIDSTLFQATTLLEKDMTIGQEVTGPKVLIYHTHSQEAFVDSIPGDLGTTITGMGEYLAQLLNEEYGIETIHHDGVYDLVDGKLDRSNAYELALAGIAPILEEYPSIEVVIDLHRDGVAEDRRLVTEIKGEQTAQIMFFNGLSRSATTGDISYLPNPYIEDNLALSLQMKLKADELYPDFTRSIYLKSYRYNMHVMPKTMLIEAGAQTNHLSEMTNAMEVLAEILAEVFVGH